MEPCLLLSSPSQSVVVAAMAELLQMTVLIRVVLNTPWVRARWWVVKVAKAGMAEMSIWEIIDQQTYLSLR